MARTVVIKPTKFTDKLARAETKIKGICEDALNEGGDYLTPKLKSSMSAAIGHGTKFPTRKTDTLVKSLGKSPVLESRKGGINLRVGLVDPREPPADYSLAGASYSELTNAMIANVIEYGKKEYDQPAKPMLRPVYTSEHETVEHILYEAVEKAVEKL
jgi:hypothetical protein